MQITMDQEKYIKERLDDQIDWYSRKSKRSQTWFKSLRILEILAAASIPFLAGYVSETTPTLKVIVGFLGVLVAVIAGVISINKFQEIWIQYRTTSENLKHHKYLYLTQSNPYAGEDAFKLLVETTESLISQENAGWSSYIKQEKNEDANSAELSFQ